MSEKYERYLTAGQIIILVITIPALMAQSPKKDLFLEILIIMGIPLLINLMYHLIIIGIFCIKNRGLLSVVNDALLSNPITLTEIEINEFESPIGYDIETLSRIQEREDMQNLLARAEPSDEIKMTDFLYKRQILWAGPVKIKIEGEQVILQKDFHMFNPFFVIMFSILTLLEYACRQLGRTIRYLTSLCYF